MASKLQLQWSPEQIAGWLSKHTRHDDLRGRHYRPHAMGAGITDLMLWAPAYMSRAFDWQPTQIGLWLGLTDLVSGI